MVCAFLRPIPFDLFYQDPCTRNCSDLGPTPLKILWNIKNISGHIVDIAMSAERHRGVQFFVHHFQRFCHAGLTHRAKTVDIRPADHRSGRAKGGGLEDILPTADAAIHPDISFAIHCLDEFRQYAD